MVWICRSVELKPLPAHLSPCDVPDSVSKAIFIYSPFQTGFQNTQSKYLNYNSEELEIAKGDFSARWVTGCAGAILVKLQNLLSFKVEVKNLVRKPFGELRFGYKKTSAVSDFGRRGLIVRSISNITSLATKVRYSFD